jgi:SAM-dependent methyltransferase
MIRDTLKSLITHPLSRNSHVDSAETTIRRAQIIQKKPFLRKLYHDCYLSILDALPGHNIGSILELGSGGGFLKDYHSCLLTSDILPIPGVDIILDGQRLPFSQASLGAIVMMDVFHHIPKVKSFLWEAARCVIPGGAVVMIEPWNTRWSRLIYSYLHHEPFEPEAKNWDLPPGGPLSQANSALPWIVFERDRKMFDLEFSEWKIKNIVLHTPFCYILSGGVAFRSLTPVCFYNLCRRMEGFLESRMNCWAMFATITLIRKGDRP